MVVLPLASYDSVTLQEEKEHGVNALHGLLGQVHPEAFRVVKPGCIDKDHPLVEDR
jgi:hypothetical protein